VPIKTVEELRNSITGYGFQPAKYNAYINSWIDEAQRYLFRRAGLRNKDTEETINITAGKNEYPLPSNFGGIHSLLLESVVPKVNLQQIFDIKSFDELEVEQNEPSAYIILNNKIMIYPNPNTNYTAKIRYKISPSSIAEENSAQPSVGEEFIYLIEEYCLYKAFGKEQDIEMANYHKGLFDGGVVEFCGYITSAIQDGTDQVEGNWANNQFNQWE
jgi:hypothetical protein